jgi:rSAM/selenodomain-associated transferase 1
MRNSTASACLLVFAKLPRPGAVKTRLAGSVGADVASQLAGAFLADTWQRVNALSWATPKLAVPPGTEAEFALDPAPELWLQGEGDLGDKLETVLTRALASFPAALALGADSPSLPAAYLESARTELGSADAVLGPADDGGFYLLGVKRWTARLLEHVAWSTAATYAQTLDALLGAGFRVRVLSPWFDIDTAADLERLRAALRDDPSAAPHTARLLKELQRGSRAARRST